MQVAGGYQPLPLIVKQTTAKKKSKPWLICRLTVRIASG